MLDRIHHRLSTATWRRLLFVSLAAAGGVSVLLAQSGGDEMVTIQRILLPPERFAKELEKVPKGGLLLFPVAEFDARLERIRQAKQALGEKPRLASAHYRAELVERSLQNGSGEWIIHHTGTAATALPIEPMNLALGRVRWQQGASAILGELDGKSLGLIVEPEGLQTCLFDWSARGTPGPEGITYTLAVPGCPISTLELTLPSDHWLAAPKGATVSGPHASPSRDKNLWKVQAAGTKPLDFTVRKIAPAKGPGMAMFARVHTEENWTPERVEVEHDFQIDILHGSLDKLFLDGDATLLPYDVSPKGAEIRPWTWSLVKKEVKGKPAGSAGEMRIDFHQPVQGKFGLKVKSLVAPAATSGWTSPTLRVRGALTRGETLEISLHPELPPGQWDFGSFQPNQVATEPGGRQVLLLAPIAADLASLRRPSLSWSAKEIDLRTREYYEWRLAPHAADLKADIDFVPARGGLFELTVKLPASATPAGYAIESLQLQPADLLKDWHLRGDVLVVELKQALTPGRTVFLNTHLRAKYPALTAGNRTHTFPEMIPMDSTKRTGTLDIFVDPGLHAQVLSSSTPLSAGPNAPADKPTRGADFRFRFRDLKLAGSIRVTPRPALIAWRGQHAVTLSDQKAALRFRWEADPVVGTPQTLDFRLGPNFPLTWQFNAQDGAPLVHHRERLYLQEALPHLLHLGTPHPVSAALVEAMIPAGPCWRLHLAEPLAKKARYTIEAESPAGLLDEDAHRISLRMPNADAWSWLGSALVAETAPKAPGIRAWTIPLAAPWQTANVDQDIAIDSPLEPIQDVDADGSLSSRTVPAKTPFHWDLQQGLGGPVLPAAAIRLRTRQEKRAALLERCDEASITTFVQRNGVVHHRVQFHLWHWRDSSFELRFPPGTKVVAAKVHDRWLERLESRLESAGVRLTLPFDQNSPSVPYEIVVRKESANPGWPGLLSVEIPRIDWPITPMDLRRSVCLEGDLTPVAREALTPMGIPARIAAQTTTLRLLRQAWDWGQSWWPHHESAESAERFKAQEQAVLTAEAQMRATGFAKPIKLSAVLDRLAQAHLKESAPLVIDEPALRGVGVSGETMLTPADLSPQLERPFWEKLGLIYVPSSKAALLTSPRRLDRLGIQDSASNADLDVALEEAVLHGHDSSAAFYLITNWLKIPGADPSSPGSALFPIGEYLGDFQTMSQWQPNPGTVGSGSFYVVHSTVGRSMGWLLACVVVVVLWKLQRTLSIVAGLRVQVLLLAAGFLAFVWLPGVLGEFFVLPLVFTIGASLVILVIRSTRAGPAAGSGGDSTVTRHVAGALALVLAFLGIAWSVSAQPGGERAHTVYLLAGKAPSVLITPELHEKLGHLENAANPSARRALLVRAKYAGHVKDSQAIFDVDYDLYTFKDQADLVIPLSGVRLLDGARLDDTPVFPTLHKLGYEVTVKNKGVHRLRLSFAVRVNPLAEHTDLRFTVPKLTQNEMALEWKSPIQSLHCKHACGAERVVEEVGKSVRAWHGELGWESDVHLHWATQAGAPVPKTIDVKEAHLWDLRPTSPALWTSLQYAVGAGSLGQLSVSLPEGLYVRSAEVMSLPPGPTASAPTPILIKQWQILGKGGQRRVQVDLAQPATGTVALNLEMVPQTAAREKQLLLLPAPLQGKSTVGLLGYRVDAAELRPAPRNLSVQSTPPAEFDKVWKKQAGPTVPQATFAWSFQRAAPQAGLELLLQPNTRQAKFQVLWQPDLGYADYQGNFTLTSVREDLMFLEFYIDPTLTLAGVSGPDVQRWHLHESVLQVWLRQPKKQTTLEISGWRSWVTKNGTPTPQTVALPNAYPLHLPSVDGTLEVRPAPGVVVMPLTMRQVRRHATEPQRFHIDAAAHEATFTLRAENAAPPALAVTRIHAVPGGIEVRHAIRLTPNRGRLPILRLLLKEAPADSFTLDAPGATKTSIKDKAAGHAGWTITYPPGQPKEVYLTLRGRMAAGDLTKTSLSTVELPGAALEGPWLVWKDVDLLHGETGEKVLRQKSVKDRITATGMESWLGEMSSWNTAERVPGLRVALPNTAASANVRVLSLRESVWRTEGGWLHGASFRLHLQEATDLRVRFPAAVEQFRALTDDRSQSAWTGAAQEFVLPLDATGSPRQLDLRWKYAPGAESATAPLLTGLHLPQVSLPTAERRLVIPLDLAEASGNSPTRPTLAKDLLTEAEAHLNLSVVLAQDLGRPEDNAKLLAHEQQQFYSCVRQAEYALAALKTASPDFDTAGDLQRLNELRRQNAERAKASRYDDQRKTGEKAKELRATVLLRGETMPLGLPLLAPAGSSLVLETAHARHLAKQRTQTEWIVLAAVFLLVISLFRKSLTALRWIGPELIVALILLGFFLYGPSVVGAIVISVTLVAHALWIGWTLRSRSARALAGAEKQPPETTQPPRLSPT